MNYVIDRIESGIAVCEHMETGDILEIDIRNLHKGAREGSVIVKNGDSFAVDSDATNRRKMEMSVRLNRLFDKHKEM